MAALMIRPCTIDASVFLNAFNPAEAGHADSHRLLARLQAESVPIIVPTLVLPEIAATISRVRGDSPLAQAFADQVSRLPQVILIVLDAAVARQAVEAAARYRLRGSDAVYAAVALRFGTLLITRDDEQYTRLKPALTTYTPLEALATFGL